MCPSFPFLVFLFFVTLSVFIIKTSSTSRLFSFLFSMSADSAWSWPSLFQPLFFSRLPSFLPPFPSLPSFSPTLRFRLAPSARAVDSPHTQRDLSPFTTRHRWHKLQTATLNYFCTLAACRSLPACQTASSEHQGGKCKPPFLDADQGGALDRLLLAHS